MLTQIRKTKRFCMLTIYRDLNPTQVEQAASNRILCVNNTQYYLFIVVEGGEIILCQHSKLKEFCKKLSFSSK